MTTDRNGIALWDALLGELKAGRASTDRVAALLGRVLGTPFSPYAPDVITEDLFGREGITIRDTDTYQPHRMLRVPTKHWSYVFVVRNGHDQAATVQLRAHVSNNGASACDVGEARTVPANTIKPFAVEQTIWAPYIGLAVSYSVQPTAGTLRIDGSAGPPV